MYFLTFAQQFAPDEIIQIDPKTESTYSELIDGRGSFDDNEKVLIQRAHVLCNQIVNRMDKLDRTEIYHVESALSDKSAVIDILESHYHGEIPDIVPIYLSRVLYKTEFNALDQTQQQIIKTLAVYICISAKDKITH